MTNRDHSMDDGIIQAAYSEFLAYGFQKASLHKIAEKAGVTTGAIYTRYKNKDALFAKGRYEAEACDEAKAVHGNGKTCGLYRKKV